MNQFMTGIIVSGFIGFLLGGMVVIQIIFMLEKKQINNTRRKKEMENIRGKRAERSVSTIDKEIILIDKETKEQYPYCYINVSNKIYWFEDYYVTWLREDSYDKYEIKEVVQGGFNV